MARTSVIVHTSMIIHRAGIVGHCLMNVTMMGMTLHVAMLMPGVLDLHHIRQTLQRLCAARKYKPSNRQNKANGIERNKNARSLYPHDPGQLRQHPEIGTPARLRSREQTEQYSQG